MHILSVSVNPRIVNLPNRVSLSAARATALVHQRTRRYPLIFIVCILTQYWPFGPFDRMTRLRVLSCILFDYSQRHLFASCMHVSMISTSIFFLSFPRFCFLSLLLSHDCTISTFNARFLIMAASDRLTHTPSDPDRLSLI